MTSLTKIVHNWLNSDMFQKYFVIKTKCKNEMITRDDFGTTLSKSCIESIPDINDEPEASVGYDDMYGEEFEEW